MTSLESLGGETDQTTVISFEFKPRNSIQRICLQKAQVEILHFKYSEYKVKIIQIHVMLHFTIINEPFVFLLARD